MRKRIRRALLRSLMPHNVWRNIVLSVVGISLLNLFFDLATHRGTWGRYAGELSSNFIIMTLINTAYNYVRDVQSNE